MKNITRSRRAVLVAAIAALALTGCATESTPEPATPSESSTSAAVAVTAIDVWTKAADGGMTGAFGEFRNGGTEDVVLVAVTTEAAARAELHEMVEQSDGSMAMQEKSGGFTIPAGESFLLQPGGNHIMLMELSSPLLPGDEVELVLEFSDGSTLPVTAVIKEYTGANEEYVGDDAHADDDAHAGHMDHGAHGEHES